jgi:hypothetical protein
VIDLDKMMMTTEHMENQDSDNAIATHMLGVCSRSSTTSV